MASPSSTQIDFRPIVDQVGVINEHWQAPKLKDKQIFVDEMLLEGKHVSDFDRVLR